MNKLSRLATLWLLLASFSTAFGNDLHKNQGGVPIIDGKEDAQWKEVTAWPLESQPPGKPISMQTTVKSMYDQNHLYFFVHCREVNLVEARQQERFGRRDAAVWNNDCVEFLFDVHGNGKSYYQFIVDIHNDIADFRHHDPDWQDSSLNWNAYWQHAVGEYADGWTVEVAIPWGMLTPSPMDSKRIAINVSRVRRIAPFERQALMPDPKSFHNLSAFKAFANLDLEQPDVTFDNVPEQVFMGDNALGLTLSNAGTHTMNGQLALTVRTHTGKVAMQTQTSARLTPGATENVTLIARIDQPGDYQFEFSYLLPNQDRKHLMSRLFNVKRVIDLNDRYSLIQQGEQYSVYVRLFSSHSSEVLQAQLLDAQGQVVLENQRTDVSESFFWTFDTRVLDPGDYRLVFSYGGHENSLLLTITPRL